MELRGVRVEWKGTTNAALMRAEQAGIDADWDTRPVWLVCSRH